MEIELVPIAIGVLIGGVVVAGGRGLLRLTARGGRALMNGTQRLAYGIRDEWREGIEEARRDREMRSAARAPRIEAHE